MEKERTRDDDYRDFIELLNKNNVDYMIIGAYAAIYYTKIPRDTRDIDFWVRRTKDNADKCANAIYDFCGLKVNPEDLIGEKEIFFIGIEPNRIDIFNDQGKLDFDQVYKKKVKADFKGIETYFIPKDELIQLKEHFSRSKDQKDIKRLKK